MKLVTKLTVIATLTTFMFAGINLTWGNTFSNTVDADPTIDDSVTATPSFGVWMDVNDSAAFGWENGLKVGFAGPAGMQMRLGMDPGAGTNAAETSIGVSRAWWTSTGDGWGTNLSTAIDWTMTDNDPLNVGTFAITMNLGFGF